jgi:hypothetical protein
LRGVKIMSRLNFYERCKKLGLTEEELKVAIASVENMAAKVGKKLKQAEEFVEKGLLEIVNIWEKNPDDVRGFKEYCKNV